MPDPILKRYGYCYVCALLMCSARHVCLTTLDCFSGHHAPGLEMKIEASLAPNSPHCSIYVIRLLVLTYTGHPGRTPLHGDICMVLPSACQEGPCSAQAACAWAEPPRVQLSVCLKTKMWRHVPTKCKH